MKDTIGGFESLYESHLKSQLGVKWKDSVAWYSLHALEQTLKLSEELNEGTYKPKPPVSFKIYRPKERDIVSVSYRDRVYQRSLNDNELYPEMTRSFVKENGACQKGRGVDYEREEILRKYLRRYYINHGCDGWVLQIDIKKYYPSMRHDVVKNMFKKKLDPEIYNLVEEVLDGQYDGDTGYNPGSQMIQIAGISLLDGLDHFIKEKLKIKYYAHYMDDIILIHPDKEYLKYCLQQITIELDKLFLTPHQDKTKIYPLKNGIEFLGFVWRVTDTGKVLMIPKSSTIKNLKHTINALLKLYKKGERTLNCVEQSYSTRISYIEKGNTYNLIKRLDCWYEERLRYYGVPEEESKRIKRDRAQKSKR